MVLRGETAQCWVRPALLPTDDDDDNNTTTSLLLWFLRQRPGAGAQRWGPCSAVSTSVGPGASGINTLSRGLPGAGMLFAGPHPPPGRPRSGLGGAVLDPGGGSDQTRRPGQTVSLVEGGGAEVLWPG